MDNTLTQVFIYVFQVLSGAYATIAVLRVLLQLGRADYYNPVSQFIVKATQPVVGPLGKLIPQWRNLDIAAVIWCLLFQVIIIEIGAFVIFKTFITPVDALIWGAIGLASLILKIFYFGLIAIIIVSFAIMLGGMHISHPALDLLRQLMAPAMAPFQKILPPMGGLDLSPFLVFMLIHVLEIVVTGFARSAGLSQEIRLIVPGI